MLDLETKQAKKLWSSGELEVSPLCWYGVALERFGNLMLNHDAVHVSELEYPISGNVFHRSNSPWKDRAGQIMSKAKAKRIGGNCWVASTKKIDREIRFYWEDGMEEVVLRYAAPKNLLGFELSIETFKSQEIIETLEQLKTEMKSFVFDVAICGEEAKILELNVPEASGIYGKDNFWLGHGK